MITKSITGPTGSGVRAFVAEQATTQQQASDILIVAAVPELCEQWRRILPGAATMTANAWLKHPTTPPAQLVIVDEMPDHAFRRLLLPMQQITTPVWLVNRSIPPIITPASDSQQAKGYLHTMQVHGRVLRGNPPRSISDDDLCATCANCIDHPRGDLSICSKGWPTIINPDGYITECAQHQPQP